MSTIEETFCTNDLSSVVESMNTLVKSLNDEEAYYDFWIDLVPDDADKEDFDDIANDKDLLQDVIKRFKRIMTIFL